jgi:hypothetical protein
MKVTLSKTHKRRTPNSAPIAGHKHRKGVKIDGLSGVCMAWKTEDGAAVDLGNHVIELDKSMIAILHKLAMSD